MKREVHEKSRLRQSDLGSFEADRKWLPVAEFCLQHGMDSAVFYKWQAKYGGIFNCEAPVLKLIFSCRRSG